MKVLSGSGEACPPSRSRTGILGSLLLLLFIWIPQSAVAQELPCLSCHEGLATHETVHMALEMGCALCHQDPHGTEEPELSLTLDTPDLCFMCHEQESFTRDSGHAPAQAGLCSSCHDPHSSSYGKLLTGESPGLCFQCHDSGMRKKKVVHRPVVDGQCGACHAAHSSQHKGLLSESGDVLCITCHQREADGAHVLVGFGLRDKHPVRGVRDPLRAGEEVSCISCHKPHSSDSRSLFIDATVRSGNLCLNCHRKIRVELD